MGAKSVSNITSVKLSLSLFFILSILTMSCDDNNVGVSDWHGSISGYIYDYETNQPLDNCTITLFPTVGSQRSTEDGSFYFSEVFAERYSILIEKYGYESYNGYVEVNYGYKTTLNITLKKETKD